jgi:hypothetical protein
MISKFIILVCLLIILYLILDLRKQVKQLKSYYKDIKLDNEIAKAKRIQASRKDEALNIDK